MSKKYLELDEGFTRFILGRAYNGDPELLLSFEYFEGDLLETTFIDIEVDKAIEIRNLINEFLESGE